MIARDAVTGLVLAGGRGSRMGGTDKGLQPHLGKALAARAIERLAPQVGQVIVNANRNLQVYESWGVTVAPDTVADFPGPLAGILAGLQRCRTPWMATVPCDCPGFPLDLVQRLGWALAGADGDTEIAIAATETDGAPEPHPVFCLLRTELMSRLLRDLANGQRKVGVWMAQQRRIDVRFADAAAFTNINTFDDLKRLESTG